ncbi:MAG TPA: YetF domain-containing protein [Burkholderiales bacterium]
METVLRTAVLYALLLALFRLTGKRTLAQVTTFDFVLLLVIGEATQNALIGMDYSVTNGLIVIVTLLVLDIGLSLVKQRSPTVTKVLEGVPVVIVDDGELLHERMDKARVDEDDIMAAARQMHGLKRLQDVRYAVLERNGSISIVPRESAR